MAPWSLAKARKTGGRSKRDAEDHHVQRDLQVERARVEPQRPRQPGMDLPYGADEVTQGPLARVLASGRSRAAGRAASKDLRAHPRVEKAAVRKPPEPRAQGWAGLKGRTSTRASCPSW